MPIKNEHHCVNQTETHENLGLQITTNTNTTTHIDLEDEFGLEPPLPIFRVCLENCTCAKSNVASNDFKAQMYLRLRIEQFEQTLTQKPILCSLDQERLSHASPSPTHKHAHQAQTTWPRTHTHRTHTDTQTHTMLPNPKTFVLGPLHIHMHTHDHTYL